MKEESSPLNLEPTETSQEEIARQKQIEVFKNAKDTLGRIRLSSSEAVARVHHGDLQRLFYRLIRDDLPEGLDLLVKMFVVIGIEYVREAMEMFEEGDESISREELYSKLGHALAIIGHKVRSVNFAIDDESVRSRLIANSPTGKTFFRALLKFDMAGCRAQVDPSLLNIYADEEEVREEYESLKDFFSQFGTHKETNDYRTSHVQESVQILQDAYKEFIETIEDTEEYKIDFNAAIDELKALVDEKMQGLKK